MFSLGYIATRLGLAAGGWILPLILFGGLSLGGAGAWLAGWTDYKSAILLVVTIAGVAYALSTNSVIGKAIAVVIVVVAAYVKGRIDEGLQTEALLEKQAKEIHQTYKDATDAEVARQAAAAEEARKAAEAEKLVWQAERDKLRQALKDLEKGAIDDPDAMRDAFSADAIKRLNQLRFERKPAAPRRLSPKAPARTAPVLDDPAVPAPPSVGPNEAQPSRP